MLVKQITFNKTASIPAFQWVSWTDKQWAYQIIVNVDSIRIYGRPLFSWVDVDKGAVIFLNGHHGATALTLILQLVMSGDEKARRLTLQSLGGHGE